MLGTKLKNAASSLGFSWPPRWNLSVTESLLFIPTLMMALAFELFGDNFGKLGIPITLPSSLGAIPNFQPKLFPMELYLLYVGVITLLQIRRWPWAGLRHPFVLLTLAFVAYGLARALPDLAANPMLVVRNSAFVWYLSLSFMICLYPLESVRWEIFFRFLYLLTFVYFAMNLAYPFYVGNPGKFYWSIDLGLLLTLAYGLCTTHKWGGRIALTSIGFVLGLSYFSSIQRTTLLGLLITNLLLFVSGFFFSERFPRPRWRRMVWAGIGVGLCVLAVTAMKSLDRRSGSMFDTGVSAIREASPGRSTDNTSQGLEKFRLFLWQDAWDEFRSAPVFGIGFHKPVVRRAYAGDGRFLENTGDFEALSQWREKNGTPPISGPHNSYLNAIARLGIFGLLLVVIHLASGWQFITRCYFACFFVLIWQMLYAFFNVGLEGPIRSFPILVLVGVALRLSVEKTGLEKESIANGGPSPLSPAKKKASGTVPKRVGLVHVPYRFVGGEDLHVGMLRESYRAIGIEPVDIPSLESKSDLLISAARSLTTGSPQEWDAVMKENKIDFLHVNNIHAALGPAFLRWIISREVPAVMTVHNHRFYCTNGLALYGNEVCKACRPRPSFLRPILRNCNSSLPKTIYHSSAMMEIRSTGLLQRAFTRFLAPSPYIARELQIAGISPSRVQVFPHAVDISMAAGDDGTNGSDIAFVGRLSPEKGVMHLLAAAEKLPQFKFTIAGEGPLEPEVRSAVSRLPHVKFVGRVDRAHALAVLRGARVVCVPSVCQESFSLVAAEALSFGARLVVPDTQSFLHYAESPISAVHAIVTNPESLAYSLATAMEQPRRSAEEISLIRERFSLQGFRNRLRGVAEEIC